MYLMSLLKQEYLILRMSQEGNRMKYELIRAFSLGVALSFRFKEESTQEELAHKQDEMPTVTKLLKQIASGDITMYESPDDEDARHLTNVVIRNQRDLAAKIVHEMGEEVNN